MRTVLILAAVLLTGAASPAVAQTPGGAARSPAPAAATLGPIALDNGYVLVSRNAAPCAKADAGRCEDRVIVSMGEITLRTVGARGAGRAMMRGQVALFKAGESYEPPTGGPYFEVTIKPNHPAIKSPPELISPPKNFMRFQNARFFIYEERLDPGDTRPRHSHSQRVEIRLNNGPMLHQWVERDGAMTESEPEIVNWREPVIHAVKNIGDLPLRNFILEFTPER